MKAMSVGGQARRYVCVAMLLVGVTWLAGCGSSKAKEMDSARVTTTLAIGPEDAQVLDAYRAFQQDYLAVGSTMNLDDPRLKAHATGDELTQLTKTFVGLKLDGDVIAGTIDVSPSLVSRDANTATVRDCSTDASRVVKQASGQTVGDGSTSHEQTLVTMQLVDGTWKVASIKHEGSGCVP